MADDDYLGYPWFGEPWPSAERRAPVCEDDRWLVPTPVGQSCGYCEEEIAQGDRGQLIPHVASATSVEWRPHHVECLMRSVMGPVCYLEGRCTHAGGTEECREDGTVREGALMSWRWLQEHGVQR